MTQSGSSTRRITRALVGDRGGNIAAVVLIAAALPLLLWWGDGQWFSLDEWSFIANRRLPSADGFFADHNGHWVTLPLIVYRVNYELFGLHTYVPYQLLVILSHLSIAATVHVLSRRAGVRPWIATAMLVSFVFYGAGWGNILFAFQITLNGSVLAGLVQFVLADHDGPWSRRDTAGVSIAVAGLMTSAVMPAVSIGVGAFVLLRRGWKVAAGHTIPPAAVFLVWFVSFGGAGESDPHPWRIVQFLFHMVRATFEGLAQSTWGGVVLAAVALLGLATSIWSARHEQDLRRAAIPVGLLTAVVAFGLLTGFNRSGFGSDIAATAGQGRYLHVSAALLLPVIALGAQQLWKWRSLTVIVPIAVIALALPDGIDQLRHRDPFTTGSADLVTAVAHSELLPQVPGDLRPMPFQDVRASWLLRAVEAGEIPDPPDDLPARTRLNANAMLALTSGPAGDPTCEMADEPIAATVDAGDTVVLGSPAQVFLTQGEDRSAPRRYETDSTVVIQAGPVDILVRGIAEEAFAACLVRAG